MLSSVGLMNEFINIWQIFQQQLINCILLDFMLALRKILSLSLIAILITCQIQQINDEFEQNDNDDSDQQDETELTDDSNDEENQDSPPTKIGEDSSNQQQFDQLDQQQQDQESDYNDGPREDPGDYQNDQFENQTYSADQEPAEQDAPELSGLDIWMRNEEPPQFNIFQSIKDKFEEFIRIFNPKYKSKQQQKNYRYGIFQKNSRSIQQHNKNPSSQYKRGETPMMDTDPKEFITGVLMQLPQEMPQARGVPLTVPKDFKMEAVDWTDYMGQVRHQGKCGSCYAFSITGVLEGLYKIKQGQLPKYSQQQLIDCCKTGCNGCRGGWPASVMDYITTQGIADSAIYPYKGVVQDCSQAKETRRIINPDDPYSEVRGVDGLAFALKTGPVSIIIDASTWDPLYKTGVFNKCPKKKVSYNHAVSCIGVDNSGVWTVRNSWGTGWGTKGNIKLPKGNSCGVADRGLIPNLLIHQLGMEMPENN